MGCRRPCRGSFSPHHSNQLLRKGNTNDRARALPGRIAPSSHRPLFWVFSAELQILLKKQQSRSREVFADQWCGKISTNAVKLWICKLQTLAEINITQVNFKRYCDVAEVAVVPEYRSAWGIGLVKDRWLGSLGPAHNPHTDAQLQPRIDEARQRFPFALDTNCVKIQANSMATFLGWPFPSRKGKKGSIYGLYSSKEENP